MDFSVFGFYDITQWPTPENCHLFPAAAFACNMALLRRGGDTPWKRMLYGSTL
jgi:hypothetical protein